MAAWERDSPTESSVVVRALLRPAHRLLMFASVVTLALNVADPLVAGEYGRRRSMPLDLFS
ncbi:MAG: hypothetical protein ACRDSK_03035 [Actinophytocola sp.]|uniref:hypothetical protein n=1 Tax=Actinophytocola sp. TaxID=1872138 RepID=UPI003D6C2E30